MEGLAFLPTQKNAILLNYSFCLIQIFFGIQVDWLYFTTELPQEAFGLIFAYFLFFKFHVIKSAVMFQYLPLKDWIPD